MYNGCRLPMTDLIAVPLAKSLRRRPALWQELPPVSTRTAAVTYIGHATVLLELNGLRLLTDPILRDRVSFLRRHQPSRFGASLLQPIDGVLLSHLHHDHLDLASLRLLGHSVPLFVPKGAGALLRRKGFRRVTEMTAGDTAQLGPLRIHATYADHRSIRRPFGPASESLGYVVAGSHSVYFAGDTDVFPGMSALYQNLDVALMPVWGWGPTLGAGHLNPARAADAVSLLQPRIAIPIHWGVLRPSGMHYFTTDFLKLPPLAFAHYASQVAPSVAVHILQPGLSLSLDHALASGSA